MNEVYLHQKLKICIPKIPRDANFVVGTQETAAHAFVGGKAHFISPNAGFLLQLG